MTLEIEDIRNISLVLPSVQLLNRADTKEEFEKQVGTEVTDEAPEGMGFLRIHRHHATDQRSPSPNSSTSSSNTKTMAH